METRTFETELAHFGVKGMRWGVRKRRGSVAEDNASAVATTPSTNKTVGPSKSTPVQVKVIPGKAVQTRGGKRHPTVDEAIDAAALRQKYHTSGKQALTNSEMRRLVDRLTLEDRLSQVAPKPKAKGRVWAEAFLKSPIPGFALKEGQKNVQTSMKGVGTAKQYKTLQGLEFAERLLKTVQPLATQKKKK